MNALSVTNSILRVIESKFDLIRATFDREGASDGSTFDRTFIEREGITFGLHFAPIQQPLQREGVTCGLHFAQIQPSQPTTLRGDTFLPTRTSKRTEMSLLYSRQSMSKLWNRILHLREGVLRKWSGGVCRMCTPKPVTESTPRERISNELQNRKSSEFMASITLWQRKDTQRRNQ